MDCLLFVMVIILSGQGYNLVFSCLEFIEYEKKLCFCW